MMIEALAVGKIMWNIARESSRSTLMFNRFIAVHCAVDPANIPRKQNEEMTGQSGVIGSQ